MIQFDDIIFFKWVGKNHQLDLFRFCDFFVLLFVFQTIFFVFQLCQFWVTILVKRFKHKNFVSPKTIKTQRSWCSGCEREENKKRVLKHLEKWPTVDQNGEWRNGPGMGSFSSFCMNLKEVEIGFKNKIPVVFWSLFGLLMVQWTCFLFFFGLPIHCCSANQHSIRGELISFRFCTDN